MKNNGYIATLIVIILGSALILAGVSSALFGVEQVNFNFIASEGHARVTLAEGCLEEVLLSLRGDFNYGVSISPFTLNVTGGSCIINVVTAGPTAREISVSHTSAGYTRKLKVLVSQTAGLIKITNFVDGDQF